MYFGIELIAPRRYSQLPDKEAKIKTKQAVATSNHKRLLGLLIVVLAALLVVQVAGSEASADLPPGGGNNASVVPNEDAPEVVQLPSAQSWLDTSPYAHEPISISSGSAGINLPE